MIARFGAAAAATCVTIIIAAAPAYAGQWMRALCQNPNGTAAPIDGLVFSGTNVGQYGGASGGDSCPGGVSGLPDDPGVGVWATVSADADAPTEATWTYSVPAGSTIAGGSITGIDIEQTTYGVPMEDRDAWISSPGDDAGADLIADCATVSSSSTGGLPGSTDPCAENPEQQDLGSPGPPPQPLVATIDDSGGTALYMTAGCSTADTDPCNYQAGSYNNVSFSAQFDWADVLLSDDTPPMASNFGGSLLASGSAHGTADLTLTAQDPAGPGVYEVIVKIDGAAVYEGTPNTNGGRCAPVATDPTTGAWVFDYQQPCPSSVDLDVPVNTTQLSDGEHEVQVIVQDAAHNSSTVIDQMITTTNLTTAAAAGHESPAPPAPPGASPAATTYAFKLGTATQALAGSVIHRRYRASGLALAGMVVDNSGTPAPGVLVTVQSSPLPGGGPTTIAQATSDGTGHFALTVPPGDSRQLQLIAGAAGMVVKEIVTPNLSLRVRSLSHARLLFTGELAIDRAGGPPPVVELEDRTPTGWQPFATTTVDALGHYRILYRSSPLTIGYIFSVRTVTAASALWQGAASRIEKVTVTG
ncbi:MAG: carboxypeptidase-like regulatory domain-containing protein [Solirubrobacteraceae bacterium]